jgi:BASS family bile acid:Na+ symporter
LNVVSLLTSLFPLWALAASLLAWLFPDWFAGLKPAIIPLLGLVMFGMGITLTVGNFTAVLRRPLPVVLGIALQYLVMPLAGWLLALLFRLPEPLLVGMVLVGCSPGGTASNVVCFLARGDVALSITLTTFSTLLAVVATPVLTWLYVGEAVPVPVLDMLWSIVRIIIVPVAVGVLLNRVMPQRLAPLQGFFPLLSMGSIVLIIAIIVALNQAQLAHVGFGMLLAVLLHNLVGMLAGFQVPRLLGRDRRECRTLAIEVGMQNSGLAVALAVKYFSAGAALPGAFFSIWHNLSGSLVAGYWRRRDY